jgi:uncharacterized protein DUF6498
MGSRIATVATGSKASWMLHPATLILIAANLIPLIGILAWDWDAFVLLVLYWMETAVIGFWTILRVATAPRASLGELKAEGAPDGSGNTSPIGLALFFILHAGIFMGVHFGFLWALFSGDWSARIRGPLDFVTRLIVDTGLWAPLLVLFIVRGLIFFWGLLGARLHAWLRPQRQPAPVALVAPGSQVGAVLGGFYARIIVMHLAILFGGFLSFFGSIVPLVILVALKTAVDVGMYFVLDVGDAHKTFNALLRQRNRS